MNFKTSRTLLVAPMVVVLLLVGCGGDDDPVDPGPPDPKETLPVGDYVLIPPTSVPMPVTFTMGQSDPPDENTHDVTLTGRFYMAETEVTYGQYIEALQWAYDRAYVTVSGELALDALDGGTDLLIDMRLHKNISFNNGVFSGGPEDHPVSKITWEGAAAYCDWVSLRDGFPRSYDHSNWSIDTGSPYSASGYRLPTEAEWELACRAGTTTPFNTGECLNAETEANYKGTSPAVDCPSGPARWNTAEVRSLPANGWGLYEMHGNVYEWCNDTFEHGLGTDPVTDPQGPEFGSCQVIRGGSFYFAARSCTSFQREGLCSDHGDSFVGNGGFRPAMSAK